MYLCVCVKFMHLCACIFLRVCNSCDLTCNTHLCCLDVNVNRGFVFQTFNLLSTMTALENVEMPMILLGDLSASERRKRAIELLDKMGMGQRLHHVPAQLSGGEQQRVTIARAIANRPEILLLDEPTGDLDTKNTLIVMDMLMRLNEDEGITLVMVTHDPMLKNAASSVVYMRDGKIHKIEQVSEKEHSEFRDKCRNELEGLYMPITKSTGHRFTSATQVRKPNDYETFDKNAVLAAHDLLKQYHVAVPISASPVPISASPVNHNPLEASPHLVVQKDLSDIHYYQQQQQQQPQDRQKVREETIINL